MPVRTPLSRRIRLRPHDGVDDRRKGVESGQCAVELAAAVVGDDDAVDAVGSGPVGVGGVEDALEDERQPGVVAQPVQVLPGQGGVHDAAWSGRRWR